MKSLAEFLPHLLKEWDYEKNNISPNSISYKSNKKAWWICSKGHSFEQTLENRAVGHQCPFCCNQKVLKGYNDLNSMFPEIAKEWDYEKNSIEPSDILYGSSKKAWWICSKCGFGWETAVINRTGIRKSGCPECGRKLSRQTQLKNQMKKEGSFADNYPELLNEWDYEKNKGINPNSLVSGSAKRVSWICKFGHKWDAIIVSRTKMKTGCPICTSKVVLKGFNDFASQQPILAKEWDYEKNKEIGLFPDSVTSHSEKKAWWICPSCNNRYEAAICHRVNGTACPKCANEMKTSFGEQAIYYYLNLLLEVENRWDVSGKEADIYIPSLNLAVEYDGEFYHDSSEARRREREKYLSFNNKNIQLIRVKENFEKKTIDSDAVYTIEILNKNYEKEIPVVIQKIVDYINNNYDKDFLLDVNLQRDRQFIYQQYIVQKKENSIASKKPEVLKEWDYERNTINPECIPVGSGKKVWWKCEQGHSYEQRVINHVKGIKCPYCSNQKVLSGYNDLQTRFPQIAKDWDYSKNELKPNEVLPFTNKRYYWICQNKHSYLASPNARCYEKKHANCPICSNRITVSGLNDLEHLRADLMNEWDFSKNTISTESVNVQSNHKVWWICPAGHSYCTYVYTRTQKGTGCPICCGKQVLAGINDLESQNPEIMIDWNYEKNEVLPSQVYASTMKGCYWKCHTCGYEWKTSPYQRIKQGQGCKICSSKRAGEKRIKSIINARGSLADNYPLLIKEWDYDKNPNSPQDITQGSHQYAWWICSNCNNSWYSEIRGRVKGYGCPKCHFKILKQR